MWSNKNEQNKFIEAKKLIYRNGKKLHVEKEKKVINLQARKKLKF